jgi:hypothetical protein
MQPSLLLYEIMTRLVVCCTTIFWSSRADKGPKLQIVLGDLIPPEELPAYKDDEKRAWLKRATSAAKLYRTDVTDYDNRDEGNDPEPDEGLAEAIRGCTIISCVGSVRQTNLWTDFLARPVWRLMRKDVSDWYNDPRHPFYVHFHTTRKALHTAEREQLRREATAAVVNGDNDSKENEIVPRIAIDALKPYLRR